MDDADHPQDQGAGTLTGGRLDAAVTSALVGITSDFLGRGPVHASTFHHGNVIVTLMYDLLTRAETVLARNGSRDAVDGFRALVAREMEAEARAAIERLTGHTVLAYLHSHTLDPDVSAQILTLSASL